MRNSILSAIVVSFCAGCSTLPSTASNQTTRALAQSEDSYFAMSTAFEYGNRYCVEFKKTEQHASDPAAFQSERRIYQTVCSSPEAMFSPLSVFVGKTRYVSHLRFLEEAFINLENSLNENPRLIVISHLRAQIGEYNRMALLGSQAPFKAYAIKEGLTTPEKYDSFWRALTDTATQVADDIRSGKF